MPVDWRVSNSVTVWSLFVFIYVPGVHAAFKRRTTSYKNKYLFFLFPATKTGNVDIWLRALERQVHKPLKEKRCRELTWKIWETRETARCSRFSRCPFWANAVSSLQIPFVTSSACMCAKRSGCQRLRRSERVCVALCHQSANVGRFDTFVTIVHAQKKEKRKSRNAAKALKL